MYFVYILECKDGSLYTGITTDVKRRFREHQKGVGSNFTRAKKAERILYNERHESRSAALKKWKREKKLALAQSKATRLSILSRIG
jgi:putative endonuclease